MNNDDICHSARIWVYFKMAAFEGRPRTIDDSVITLNRHGVNHKIQPHTFMYVHTKNHMRMYVAQGQLWLAFVFFLFFSLSISVCIIGFRWRQTKMSIPIWCAMAMTYFIQSIIIIIKFIALRVWSMVSHVETSFGDQTSRSTCQHSVVRHPMKREKERDDRKKWF